MVRRLPQDLCAGLGLCPDTFQAVNTPLCATSCVSVNQPRLAPIGCVPATTLSLGEFRLRAKKQNTRAVDGTLSPPGFLIRHPAWPSEPCGTGWSTPSGEFHGILVASIRGRGRPVLRFSDVSSNVGSIARPISFFQPRGAVSSQIAQRRPLMEH